MSSAELRSADFAFGANCVPPAELAGGFIEGALNATRHVVAAEALFRAYHECDGVDTDREAYATVYQYPSREYTAHLRRVGSPRGYAGPAACCRLPWDIDRDGEPDAALADTRKLVRFLWTRYEVQAYRGLSVHYSGAKGYHVTLLAPPGFVSLAHVPPAVKLLCLTLAREAGVRVDPAIYDRQRLFRLPNTRHPRSGLYKRFLDAEELLQLSASRVRDLASHPAGYPVPSVAECCEQFTEDWKNAEEEVLRAATVRMESAPRTAPSCFSAVPHFVRQFIGFQDIQEPGRERTVFRCAAALSQAGTPEAVIRGLLEEPAWKTGLPRDEVEKAISDGIAHGRKGRAE